MKKHVRERRERLRKLGERDAANRCIFCRRPFPSGQTELIRALGGHPGYCTEDCMGEAIDATAAREARR
jgi:hypothetical protein